MQLYKVGCFHRMQHFLQQTSIDLYQTSNGSSIKTKRQNSHRTVCCASNWSTDAQFNHWYIDYNHIAHIKGSSYRVTFMHAQFTKVNECGVLNYPQHEILRAVAWRSFKLHVTESNPTTPSYAYRWSLRCINTCMA